MSSFTGGLPASQVHSRLQAALAELRLAEQNAVLWFAEIHARQLYRELGFASIQQYASEALGFSRSKTSQFMRLAEAMRQLPALKKSLAAGELPWTKAREVAKVATRQDEKHWIREACRSSRRELEEKVAVSRARARRRAGASAGQGELPVVTAAGVVVSPRSPSAPPPAARVGVSLQFSAEQFARFEALLERLRKQVGRKSAVVPNVSSREALILAGLVELLGNAEQRRDRSDMGATGPGTNAKRAAGNRATGHDAGNKSARRADEFTRVNAAPAYQIVVTQCATCRQGQVPTSRGPKPLPAAAMAAIACDARILQPGQRNKATIAPAVRRSVMARDAHRCRMPGCNQVRFLEVHHKVPRAAGGTNDPENLITLCERCHRFLHEWAAQRTGRSALADLPWTGSRAAPTPAAPGGKSALPSLPG